MTKQNEISESGITLLLPTDSSYAKELENLGFDDSLLKERGLCPVIFKNCSLRTVVAFRVDWEVEDSTGFIWNLSCPFMQPECLRDGHLLRSTQYLAPPGALLLFTVRGHIWKPELVQNEASRFASEPHAIVSARIDAAIFDDGAVVGPDKGGSVARFKAMVDGRQDSLEEIAFRLSLGHSLHEIVTTIRSEKVDADPHDPEFYYHMFRQNLVSDLFAVELLYDEQVAISTVASYKYHVRPNIHRIGSGPAR